MLDIDSQFSLGKKFRNIQTGIISEIIRISNLLPDGAPIITVEEYLSGIEESYSLEYFKNNFEVVKEYKLWLTSNECENVKTLLKRD